MSYNNTMILNENSSIVTDEKIILKLDWIKVVENKDECFQIQTYLDKGQIYQICRRYNPKNYQLLQERYKFSKK